MAETVAPVTRETLSRRDFLAGSVAVGAAIALAQESPAAADGKKTFTILHTNDMHSAFIGMGPAADYTPFTPPEATGHEQGRITHDPGR